MQKPSSNFDLWKIGSFLFLFLFLQPAFAQQQVPNLREIKVDELSDAQIQKFIDQAEAGGYSESQLELLARSRGMSETEINKLRTRVNKLGSSTGENSGLQSLDRSRSNQMQLDQNRSTAQDPFQNIYDIDTTKTDELEIFGSSFFQNSSNSFEPSLNVATPVNYLLGPGDQIIIDVWGASEQTYQLTISPEGSIMIPSVGPIFLNGYTLDKADARIKYRLKSIYSTLGENTYAQLSLGQLRTITVNVVGEVERPGSYPLSAFASVLNALQVAGGPSEQGSYRRIHIYRNSRLIATEDLYQVLALGGGLSEKLQDQDVIMVPPYLNRITIKGEVKRPAIYEAKDKEMLSHVLDYAGGFSENAYSKSVSIRRNLANAKTVKTIEQPLYDQFALKAGDVLEVSEIQEQFTKRVRVEGAVNHPGEFEIKPEMRLSDVIKLSEGFRGDVYLDRALIIRELPNYQLQTIPFSPEDVMEGRFDTLLLEEDLIKVHSIFDLRENYRLTIQGEVQNPGEYPYTNGMAVEDLIYLSGGFKESAARSFVEVARRILDSEERRTNSMVAQIFNFPITSNLVLSQEDNNFQLKPFDVVIIRSSPLFETQTVMEIEGEVVFPGKYVLEKRDERISDILARAKGLTEFAYAKGATLIRRTEFYVDPKSKNMSEKTNSAAKLRKSDLQELFERDTTVLVGERRIKMQESIGIELDKIIQNPLSEEDLILKEGDILSIPRALQTVRIRGEVLYPSTILHKGGSGLRRVVAKTGGFTERAQKRKSYVIYANGSAQKTSSFLGLKKYPLIQPGAEIIIPTKPERRKLTPGEVLGLTTGIGTLSFVILQIVNLL
ncbi:MAG: protein involved in polysaccharide export with SLBB domain [Parvicella sp.]|jgi:protein involved in polysaccharide export with SLBB domain